MAKYDGLERDANVTVKAILFEIEEAASQDPIVAAHPYEMEKRRKRVVRKIWGLVKSCMKTIEEAEREHARAL